MKHAKSNDSEPHRKTPAKSVRPAAAKPTNRSRLTNGSQLFLERLDGRSRDARRWRDLYCDFLKQTGGKNETLVRTLASLCLQRDILDVRLAKGEPVDTAALLRTAGLISRLMSKLNIVDDPAPDPLPADAPAWLLGPRAPEQAKP